GVDHLGRSARRHRGKGGGALRARIGVRMRERANQSERGKKDLAHHRLLFCTWLDKPADFRAYYPTIKGGGSRNVPSHPSGRARRRSCRRRERGGTEARILVCLR